MLAAYQPLPNFTPSTIQGTPNALIPYSQRPHAWISAQTSKGAEMVLPFFWPRNWLRVGKAQDFIDMGQLDLINYTALQSANGATGSATVTLYAWMEDVTLSGSTLGLAAQSKERDEYGTGPISAPATAIAKAAGALSNAPVIGPYATATEVGAKAVARIAKMFGYTNVPVLDETKPYRPSPFPRMAAPDIGYPVDKLTLDCKNELSVDPKILGLDGKDELDIVNFASRESYLTTATWSTTNNQDDILFSSKVTPLMYNTTGSATNNFLDLTPMGLLSGMFNSWRGDINFTFRVIASPYHKGRLIIGFDPAGTATSNIINTPSMTSAIYTEIIDIEETNEVTIRVPYQQALAYLDTNAYGTAYSLASRPWSTSASPTFVAPTDDSNGTLVMRVLTGLTAPTSASSVSILVSVAAADNFEFASPCAWPVRTSTFVAQSQEMVVGMTTPVSDDRRERVVFGEKFRSLRPLLRRNNYVGTSAFVNANTSPPFVAYYNFHKLPPYYGYDPTGENVATAIAGGGASPFNFVNNNPVNLLAPCFVGYRGSGIWTFSLASPNSAPEIRVIRVPSQNRANGASVRAGLVTSADTAAASTFYNFSATQGGLSLVNNNITGGVSVLCPNYTPFRFQSTAPGNTTLPVTSGTSSAFDGSSRDTFTLEIPYYGTAGLNTTTTINKFWGAGTDFGLYFFLNVPTLRRYANDPIGT